MAGKGGGGEGRGGSRLPATPTSVLELNSCLARRPASFRLLLTPALLARRLGVLRHVVGAGVRVNGVRW